MLLAASPRLKHVECKFRRKLLQGQKLPQVINELSRDSMGLPIFAERESLALLLQIKFFFG